MSAKIQVERTESEIVALLNGRKGKAFCTIEMSTIVPLNYGCRMGVPSNPYTEGVRKHAIRRCEIGLEYENMVNRNLRKEGKDADFVAEAPWKGYGRRESLIFQYHVDRPEVLYIKWKPLQYAKGTKIGQQFPPLMEELTDIRTGESVTWSDLTQWNPPKKKGDNQGLAYQRDWRTLFLSNLITISLDGFAVINVEGIATDYYNLKNGVPVPAEPE